MKGNPNFAARRSRRPQRRHGGTGFPKLVVTLAGATFLGVYGLMTPEKVATSDPADLTRWDRPWQRETGSSEHDVSAYYPNCAAARAAGAAPLHSGESGYRSELDRDGDGVACEPYYGR